jgi:hypothetical protein
MSEPTFSGSEATSLEFWRELCPALSIESTPPTPRVQLPAVDRLTALIATEGYVNEPGVFAPGAIEPLRDCILRLHRRGISPGFAFVYDQFWVIADGLAPYLSAVLGADYRILPAFWAWCVQPSNDAAGWKAHRDRPNSRDADGRPQSLTVWLPLTDATPLNGCMYLLPAHLDPDIAARQFDGRAAERFTPATLQNLRALPAPAGSLLSWHQEVLHWGSRASVRGGEPRISLSHEFQRGDCAPFATPLFQPGELPSFHTRLGWIGKLLGNYAKHQDVGGPIARVLAAALERKFAVR